MISESLKRRIKTNTRISPKRMEVEDNDFVVRPLSKMRLIDIVGGLDDECEFEKNMYNFGDEEDLPESDRATDCRCKNS